jgi:DNA-binding response OmpR family regulator
MSTATILLVSDDPLLLDGVERTLDDAGYHVLSGCASEALGIAHEVQPAVIVLDSRGPDAGAALCARLHALQATTAIPVILLIEQAPQGSAVSLVPSLADQPPTSDIAQLATVVADCVQAQGTDR